MPSYIDIHRWIQDHASAAVAATTAAPPRRKRALAEMDANVEMGTTPKRSLRKLKKTGPEDNISTNDTDATPRAPQPQPQLSKLALAANAPVFAPSAPTKRAYNDVDSEPGASLSAASSSKKSRRAQSPQKEMAARRYAPYPVQRRTLADLTDAPADVRCLAEGMDAIGDGIELLPKEANTQAWRDALKTGNAKRDERLFLTLFRDKNDDDRVPDLDSLRDLVQAAEENRLRAVSEAAWNSSVHHPLLHTALRGSHFRSTLRFDNITTASIEPSSLVASQAISSSEAAQSRKVDFCLTLTLSDIVKKHLVPQQIRLNQTDYTPIEYDAIAVSIETKPSSYEGGPEGSRQLSTWVQAQITRLRELLVEFGDQEVDIPAMPLLMVQGHEWRFLCFKDEGVGRGGTFYDSGILFGSTAGLLDACKAVAGLRMLMEWAEEVWRPWLQREIIRKILERIGTQGTDWASESQS